LSVAVVERHGKFGQETSSRNSEVIHAGIYYPPGSLKAVLCRRGRDLLYATCDAHNIPCHRLGKLMVAVEENELPGLAALYRRGRENGVDDLELLDAAALNRLEPAVRGVAALWSPSTGIIASHALMLYYQQAAKTGGVMFAFGCTVAAIRRLVDAWEISTTAGDRFTTRRVINAAGLGAATISRLAGIPTPTVYYARGCYVGYSGRSPVKRLIYPVPGPACHGLGIHATLDLAGRLRFGPDVTYVDTIDYRIPDNTPDLFLPAIHRYLPEINRARLHQDTAGIRPKLQGPTDDRIHDFYLRDESERGFPGLINLLGIESPGLTAAPAIAEHVAGMLERT
jgi:L-2-hydroxyglutarate oxidase LhgO